MHCGERFCVWRPDLQLGENYVNSHRNTKTCWTIGRRMTCTWIITSLTIVSDSNKYSQNRLFTLLDLDLAEPEPANLSPHNSLGDLAPLGSEVEHTEDVPPPAAASTLVDPVGNLLPPPPLPPSTFNIEMEDGLTSTNVVSTEAQLAAAINFAHGIHPASPIPMPFAPCSWNEFSEALHQSVETRTHSSPPPSSMIVEHLEG